MGPDDALRLADWVGGLFPEATPQQVEYLSNEFAAFDVAVVEQEVARYRRQFDAFNVFGSSALTSIQTSVNGLFDAFSHGSSEYGKTRGRVPPRTLRFGAAWRF